MSIQPVSLDKVLSVLPVDPSTGKETVEIETVTTMNDGEQRVNLMSYSIQLYDRHGKIIENTSNGQTINKTS
jgi:hypothetical protein